MALLGELRIGLGVEPPAHTMGFEGDDAAGDDAVFDRLGGQFPLGPMGDGPTSGCTGPLR